MTAIRRQTMLFTIVLATFACMLAVSPRAHAATIPAESARQFYSVQSQGDRVFWFQRSPQKLSKTLRRQLKQYPRYYRNIFLSDTGQPGVILSRQLNSSVVQPIYLPPAGQRIAGFKIRAGRIVIAISAVNDAGIKPTEVLELKQNGAVWTPTPLIQRTGVQVVSGTECGSQVHLLNVNDRGEVIVDDRSFEGRGPDCHIVRGKSQLIAIAPDGTQRSLQTRVSGWAPDKDAISFDGLGAGPGDGTSAAADLL